MHVEQNPETMFPGEQDDFSNCSNVGMFILVLNGFRDEAPGLDQRVSQE